MVVLIRMRNLSLALTMVLLLAACQPQNLRPDGSPDTAAVSDDAMQLQQQAYQAYRNGDWAAAEQAYVALTRQVPKEAEPWFRLGNIYARQERPQAAIAAYQEALVRKPEHAKAWHNMGIIQLRQASNSFMYLESVTESGDPLHDRASVVLETMTQLLETDFNTPANDLEDSTANDSAPAEPPVRTTEPRSADTGAQ